MIFGNKYSSREKSLRVFEANPAACLVQDGSQAFKSLSRQQLWPGEPFHSNPQRNGLPQMASTKVCVWSYLLWLLLQLGPQVKDGSDHEGRDRATIFRPKKEKILSK